MSELEYGLLGEKLGHSFSPAIHRKLAGYDYRLVEKSRRSWRTSSPTVRFRG